MRKKTPSFQRTTLARVVVAVCSAGAAVISWPAAMAQNAPVLQRVEVTGSAIKQIDAETAVPVTVYKIDTLKSQGISTVEQIMSRISSSQSQTGTSQSVGAGTGGAAFADMRGLGPNKTLVLLDGRRIANNTIDGSAPDLNMVPFAALERVEVLRDGASALYGTDAIGGVINFITRKSFQGGTASVGYDSPQHPGGREKSFNAGYGVGDFDKDGFNLVGVIDYQKQDKISAVQRAFGSTGYIPDRGVFKSSGSSDPANYSQGGPSANPAGPACNSNPYIFNQSGNSCRYDYTKSIDLIPKSERVSVLLKGALRVTDSNQINLSYFATQNKNNTQIAPVPFAALTMNPGTPFFPGNGITPVPTSFTIDPTKPINIRWRDVPNGGRAQQDTNLQQRFVAEFQGNTQDWDYRSAFTYNVNTVRSNLTGGYADGALITPGVANGIINPFGPQTAVGQSYLNSALVTGQLTSGKSDATTVDARASRELGDWLGAGRQAALAVGAEFRHETLRYNANTEVAAKVVSSTGVDPTLDQRGKRSVVGAYTELNLPVTKTLDVTGSIRYDRFSDFGNTVNPKASFRFQPSQPLLVRGSVSTGFRAPSLFELNNPVSINNTANSFDDPIRCPNGVAQPGVSAADNCQTQFLSQNGGNKNLQPEKSKSATLGFVLEPAQNLTIGVDFWWVRLKNSISVLPDTLIFADPVKYAGLFKRAADGSLGIDGSQCPGPACGYVIDTTSNLGGINTHGIDLSGDYKIKSGEFGNFTFAISGVYVAKYEYQQEQGGKWNQNAGVYVGTGPISRWKHSANIDWNKGDWGAGIVNNFKSGYEDQNDPSAISDPKYFQRVGSYTTWDLYGSWKPVKAVTLNVGVKNVFDKEPPFSNQGATFQVGYDPRFTNPSGRAYYLRGNYTF